MQGHSSNHGCIVTREGLRYFRAPAGFEVDASNPFCADGTFGRAWSAFLITDDGAPVDFAGCNKARSLFFYRRGLIDFQ